MSIYDVNHNKQITELLPPDKRYIVQIKWLQALFAPLVWLHDLLFTSYRSGSAAENYAPGVYNKNDQVVYRQAVYMSLIDNNISSPLDTLSWIKIQNNFLGAKDRVKYNGQVLVLEYALNQWFQTQFRQPPNQSDIYLTIHRRNTPVFIVGSNVNNSSKVGKSRSTEFVTNVYDFLPYNNMTINIPLAIWTSLDTIEANRDRFVRSFADKYIVAGIIYNISTY